MSPTDDDANLSDLTAIPRGTRAAGLLMGTPSPSSEPIAPPEQRPEPPAPPTAPPAPQPPATRPAQTPRRPAQRSRRPVTTLYMTPQLRERVERYRAKKSSRTTGHVILEAIATMRDRLGEILEDSTVAAADALPGDLFPEDGNRTRYLGKGTTQLQFTVTAAQLDVIDRLTAELGQDNRAWITPILNAFLPGRREQ